MSPSVWQSRYRPGVPHLHVNTSYVIKLIPRYFPFVIYLVLHFSYNCYAYHYCRWFSLILLIFCRQNAGLKNILFCSKFCRQHLSKPNQNPLLLFLDFLFAATVVVTKARLFLINKVQFYRQSRATFLKKYFSRTLHAITKLLFTRVNLVQSWKRLKSTLIASLQFMNPKLLLTKRKENWTLWCPPFSSTISLFTVLVR